MTILTRSFIVVPLLFVFGCASQKSPEAVMQTSAPFSLSHEQDRSVSPSAIEPKVDEAHTEALPAAHDGKTASKADPIEDEQGFLDTALELTETAQEYWEENDMDQAIESLDQAYALLLKVAHGNNLKLSQQKEDLRFMISKRITELYASRSTTVNGNFNAIPMTMNDHVEREIKSFQTVERVFFLEAYKRSGRYRGEMVNALKEAGMPEELSWLPLIESGYKVRALSRARALGLWQFIPSTGYKFGLKRNDWIDERLDPAKSTAAAIAYFKELHGLFGDWATVLAAYNCGEGSVGRVIRSQKVNYLDNFWDLYERLPRETARYFPRFLAVMAIINDPAKYGFSLSELDSPLPYEVVTIERPVHLKTLADKAGMELEELTALNPELRRDATPDAAYALRVTPGKATIVQASLDKLPKWSPPKVEYVMHRVRRGDTLSLIALRYRTSMVKIMEANNLRRGKLLRIGQRLKIPAKNSA
jgi:membrane-bound lytic murein transglycosylase D